MLAGQLQAIPHSYATDDDRGSHFRTETPIEHLIVVIPENRSYDHTYGTYRPRHGQFVSNLLFKDIVNADGPPGPNSPGGAHFPVPPQPGFYIGAPAKTPFAVLPAPDTSGTPTAPRDTAPPFTSLQIAAVEQNLETADLALLTTGASGLPARSIDTRVTNAANLPNGPFQLTGPTMPYDAYTGDTIHRFFQMWQQSDCSLANATRGNPSGCLNDLYPFVNTTFNTNDNGVGNSMAIFNVNDGDAPLFKRLADEFASSDNFHQSVMGGTAANHVMLGTGDSVYFSDGNRNALAPAADLAVNLANGSTNPADAIGAAYCQICNPFQYAKSIMGDPVQRAEHIKDTADLLADIDHGTLPSVSFAKPDGLLDGHPQSSKLGLFEAYLRNILDRLDQNPRLKAKTAVFVVFDEGGGYWDSGFLQPLDFFGDGPRIPFIVVSQFSRGGKVSHTYTDHVSILKFIERNWRLAPLTARSRDNLPNPIHRHDVYVPANMPAIGDLFDMFDFEEGHDR